MFPYSFLQKYVASYIYLNSMKHKFQSAIREEDLALNEYY